VDDALGASKKSNLSFFLQTKIFVKCFLSNLQSYCMHGRIFFHAILAHCFVKVCQQIMCFKRLPASENEGHFLLKHFVLLCALLNSFFLRTHRFDSYTINKIPNISIF